MAILEKERGLSDQEVVALANKEKRIIVTFDSDYGTLIYRERLEAPSGVVYLRFTPKFPEEAAEIILSAWQQSALNFEGVFTVITRTRIRQRPLPTGN